MIVSGKLDGECLHTNLLHGQRERVSEQLLNEDYLIITEKFDGECEHTYLLHRQRERVSNYQMREISSSFFSELAHKEKCTNKTLTNLTNKL